MADKKNIVIKVKYPTSGRKPERPAPAVRKVTEWNIKRILYAAALLALFLTLLLFYWLEDDTREVPVPPEAAVNSPPEENTQAARPGETNASQPVITPPTGSIEIDKTVVKPETEVKKQKQTDSVTVKESVKKPPTPTHEDKASTQRPLPPKLNRHVRRALLTHEISHKEPVGEITRTISASNEKSLTVYYFTELKDMKGQKINHEWRRNGTLVARNFLNISADSWRTFSHKLLSSKSEGNWTVKLIDEKGRVLNEKTFKVAVE
jgi:hypothetical protein